ncbi:MAG TPA: universal stress protein [Anaerolineae bacterium]|nr:universal stress protein [Anaerolineae bacterium]
MGKILCATRGGEASYRTQDRAIELALQRGDELVFLYVVNIEFLNKTAAPIVVDVATEIERMGEFLLAMAQERAREAGVEASLVTRKGDVREQIKAAAVEEGVDLVVLGRPADEASLFKPEALRTFAAEIEEETGIPAVILET